MKIKSSLKPLTLNSLQKVEEIKGHVKLHHRDRTSKIQNMANSTEKISEGKQDRNFQIKINLRDILTKYNLRPLFGCEFEQTYGKKEL